MSARCFFAGHGPCAGRLVAGHLIPAQLIRREVSRDRAVVWDERVLVPICGGAVGLGGHHGQLDHSRTLRIARADLPASVEDFAREHGLEWYLTREYGALVAGEAEAAA